MITVFLLNADLYCIFMTNCVESATKRILTQKSWSKPNCLKTLSFCNNGFQLQVSNNISRVNSVFVTNMTHPVKGDSGTDRQCWFQAGSVSLSISNHTRNGAVSKLTEAFQGKNVSGVGKLQLFENQNGCVFHKEIDVALAQCSVHAALVS